MSTSDTVRIADFKAQAKRLRDSLHETTGASLTHSQALELVARQHGARDWNTLRARNRPLQASELSVGTAVRGRYLGQAFTGHVLGLTMLGGDRFRITLHFDEPVDVVTFESFSALRQRVTCVVDAEGRSPAKTSDGLSHLIIDALC